MNQLQFYEKVRFKAIQNLNVQWTGNKDSGVPTRVMPFINKIPTS